GGPRPSFPEVLVGEPLCYESLAVFPLFSQSPTPVQYLLSDEAIAHEAVKVEEVGEAGSVPPLLVEHQAGLVVLFPQCQELQGAKQNRVLNASILVTPRSKLVLPVSCVEEGRWRYKTRHFTSSGSHSSTKLRHVLKKTVSRSARGGEGHASDQGAVWKEVE